MMQDAFEIRFAHVPDDPPGGYKPNYYQTETNDYSLHDDSSNYSEGSSDNEDGGEYREQRLRELQEQVSL